MNRTERAREVLRRVAHGEVGALAANYPDERSLELDWQAVRDQDPDLATDLVRSPDAWLDTFEEALRTYSESASDVDTRLGLAHVRVVNFPDDRVLEVGEERQRDLNQLVALEGQITQRTEVNPKLDTGVFDCHRCGATMRVPQGYGSVREPYQCENCETNALTLNRERSEWVDHQVIRLQQPPEAALDGVTATMDIHLLDDLCGDVQCGQRATFVGKFEPVPNKQQTRHRKALRANAFELEQQAFEEIETSAYADAIEELANNNPFARLVASLAPGHEGDRHVKEALVLLIFGGWDRTAPDGTYHRGNSHVFLIGDPGTGKSTLMQAVENTAPRASMTDGTGTSGAGLTAALTKDDFGDGAWTIEAGTLVRANDGVAIVDELDKANREDIKATHTALESQEVLISKAGQVARMPARTALLAAANPTGGHFDPTKTFVDQVDLQSPLLSRFDLIFVMREKTDDELVEAIGEHMIDSRQTAGRLERGLDVDPALLDQVTPDLDHDLIEAYVAYAKQEVQPVIRDEAVRRAMVEYYTDLKTSIDERSDDAGPPLPVTARKQVAIQRLAEASARTRLDDEIRLVDVDRATRLIDRSLADLGIAPGSSRTVGRAENVAVDEVGLAE